MENYLLWLEAIAAVKTLYELGKDIPATIASWNTTVELYKITPDIIQQARQASITYKDTFSDDELQDIINRIRGCRDRSIAEGDPKRRVSCLCNVLSFAKDGNGGDMPDVGGWQDMYDQLKCKEKSPSTVSVTIAV